MKVGVIGAGQLGRMLALSGIPLGYEFRFFETSKDSPASCLGEVQVGKYDDLAALRRFAERLDVITYEFENIPAKSAEVCANRAPLYPPYPALETSQNRLSEKSFFVSLQIPTPKYASITSKEDLARAVDEIGMPSVLKTTTLGYDGKGQAVIRSSKDIKDAWKKLGTQPLILEEFIPFSRELSIIAARSTRGEVCFYPLAQNEHKEGILRVSTVPAPALSEALERKAEDYISRIMNALNYVGVIALELFERDGELIANEMAPRVHNSGHWSIDGAVTSQFENHLRAISGLPLGSTKIEVPTVMINLIGTVPSLEKLSAIEGVHLHLYGKSPRPGRKLGHVNICAHNPTALAHAASKVKALLSAGL